MKCSTFDVVVRVSHTLDRTLDTTSTGGKSYQQSPVSEHVTCLDRLTHQTLTQTTTQSPEPQYLAPTQEARALEEAEEYEYAEGEEEEETVSEEDESEAEQETAVVSSGNTPVAQSKWSAVAA